MVTNSFPRAITGFIRLDRDTYRRQIADALIVLRRVKAEFEFSGYEVESLRLTTQPLAELVAGLSEYQALAFLGQFDQLSVKENFIPNVGPAMMHDSDDQRPYTCWSGRCRLCQTSRPAPSSRMKSAFIGNRFIAPLNL